jgi:hypothetical protein
MKSLKRWSLIAIIALFPAVMLWLLAPHKLSTKTEDYVAQYVMSNGHQLVMLQPARFDCPKGWARGALINIRPPGGFVLVCWQKSTTQENTFTLKSEKGWSQTVTFSPEEILSSPEGADIRRQITPTDPLPPTIESER